MVNAIKEFIGSVPKGHYFDTHTLIEYLIQKHSDVYLDSFCKTTTSLYHGYIGQVLRDNFVGISVTQIGESFSKNIHDGYSGCTLWKKD